VNADASQTFALTVLGDPGGDVVLKSLGHHAVFLLLLQLAVLLATARLLGELVRKFKQPAVIGELAAGVLLGPLCSAR